MTRWRAHRRRSVFERLHRTSTCAVLVAIVLWLAAAGAVAVLLGDDAVLVLPVLVVPVVLAGVRFRTRAAVVVAVAAGVIGGSAATALDAQLDSATVLAMAATLLVVAVGVGAVAAPRVDELARAKELSERERELARQRAALVQVVSHELRTPLTVIRGGLDTLSTRPGAVASEFEDLLRATVRSTTRLEELLGVVLAAADELGDGSSREVRPERAVTDIDARPPLEAREVELWPVVRDAAASVQADLPQRLRYRGTSDASIVTVEPELWLTLRCLLDNAVKFGPVDEAIDVSFDRSHGEVVISVRDRGPGLPEGFEKEAFAPFTPGDTSLVRPHAGLGMGLYTARRLARRLGGDVAVASRADGLVASVRLPQPDTVVPGGGHRDALESSSR